MNTQNNAEIRKLENEVREIQYNNKGKIGLFIQKILENHGFQLTIILGGLVVTMVNVYIAYRLAPLTQDLAVVVKQVDAESQNLQDHKVADNNIQTDFITTKTQVADILRRLGAMENTDIRIENKLDTLLLR